MGSEVKYILMNKNTPVLAFKYDSNNHIVTKILDVINPEYAPVAIINQHKDITKKSLNDWWRRRAIPASRNQIQAILDQLNLESTLSLAEKNFGLSLSDRYWINDAHNPQNWEDINFFDNDFTDDLGLLTLGQDSSGNPNLMSPNSTLNGDLKKKWTIVDGHRLLVKSGSGFTNQEVYNEIIATNLHQRLLSAGEYVPYFLHTEGRNTYCACPNMLEPDEELIPAADLLVNRKKSNNINDFQFLVSIYEELGFTDVESDLCKMFACDFILANPDRHYRNFGVIRNVETLDYTRIAPIYDSGTCLWCRAESLVLPEDFEYVAKPLGQSGMNPMRQIAFFRDFTWFDSDKLDGFTEEAIELLSRNDNFPEQRLSKIKQGITRNIKKLEEAALLS